MSSTLDLARAAAPLRFKFSLRTKLVALTLLGFVAALCIALLSLAQMRSSASQAAFSVASHMASTLALQVRFVSDTEQDLLGGRSSAMQRLVDYVHDRDGRDLEVVDSSLKIVADAEHKDIGKSLDRDEASTVAATLADGIARSFVEAGAAGEPGKRQVVVPIPHGAGHSQNLALVFEYTALLDEMNAAATRSARDLLLAAAPIAVLLVLSAAWGARRIVRAIRNLQTAAAGLAEGRRPQRATRYGSDELGDLARAFDRMAEQVSASDAALRAEVRHRRCAQEAVQLANEELERRVLERTSMLTLANVRLDAELTERRRVEVQLEQLARFDPLTGLPNRRLFLEHVEEALQRRQRNGNLLGLLFVDLDRFKAINDSLGHDVGDRVLQQVAERLKSLLRQTDVVSRIGGDEFTVIVDGIDTVDALQVIASKVVEGFQRPLTVNGAELFVTLSIGIAVAPDDGCDVGELLKRADFAMYQVKADGRNAFQFHSETMSAASRGRLAIERGLRHALERKEFALHYQVRVSAKSGLPVGMEALLRWNSPELGAVPPADFIPVAEETGLILPLGEWVLRTACEQHSQWRGEGFHPGVMAVNVSARQFRQPDFAGQVLRIAGQAGTRPQDIELEVTESMLMHDPEAAAVQMTRLREVGFGIAVDDFGTGYSSLSHLKRFPASRIKIDRYFVRDIDTDPDDAAIATAIVALARSLHIPVTAEGIETPGQLLQLGKLDCSEYQGFLFSQPLPPESMREVLRRGLRSNLPLTGDADPLPVAA
jgi:diguanylate cyclase (GGDEF)-like protein